MQMERNKNAGIAILTSEKIDLKNQSIARDKGHYLKRTIQKDNITLVNNYSPKIGAPKYVKQILINIKGESGTNRVIVVIFNTHDFNA